MTSDSLRRWRWIHTWSSLISTIFLLLLCVTGLPLIFHHEIDHVLHEQVEAAEVTPGTPRFDLDEIERYALARHPGKVAQLIFWDKDDPNAVMVIAGDSLQGNFEGSINIRMDAHTGGYLDAPDTTGRLTTILFKLHTDLYAGLPGKLFLGVMGLFFVVAVISGVILYGPSMRRLAFGTIRSHRPRRVRWLDLHNLLGAVTIAWMIVVGFTGVINTWADLVIKLWQYDQLTAMAGPFHGLPVPEKRSPIDAAVVEARQAAPGMTPSFVAYPGTMFSSTVHYAVFLHGNTPLTSRLLKPALIDATTGKFTDSRDMPWYVTALFVSQPLHFGDYGGLPLKIVWSLMTLATIAILITGLYIWWRKRPKGRRASHFDPPIAST